MPQLPLPADEIAARADLIARLTERVDALKAEGATERAAVRRTAEEFGMHPLAVKRLAVLFPEA